MITSKWFVVAATVLTLMGCDKKSGTSPDLKAAAGGKSSLITVAMLPKKKGIPYFTTCAEGAQEAADELGNVKLIYDGPTDGSPETAASMIEQWTLKGVDVIAVSPNDPQVLAPAMKAAMAKGVKVITFDADGLDGTRQYFVNQASAQQIGTTLVDTLVKDMGTDTGEIAIITATLTAANQNQWIGFIKEQLAAKYPKLNLVSVQPSNDDQKLAFTVTQDLIKAHPDLKGVLAITSAAFPGSAEAIKQSGKAGTIQVTGLSTPNDMRQYVKDGVVKSVVLWNTVDLGYLTVQTARALYDGKISEDNFTFTAGRLGERKIAAGQVPLGGMLIFNKDNIDQYSF